MTLSFLSMQTAGSTGAGGIEPRAPQEALSGGVAADFAARLHEQLLPPAPPQSLPTAPAPAPAPVAGPPQPAESKPSPEDEAQPAPQQQRGQPSPRSRAAAAASAPGEAAAAVPQRVPGAAAPAGAAAAETEDLAPPQAGGPATRKAVGVGADDRGGDPAVSPQWMLQMLVGKSPADEAVGTAPAVRAAAGRPGAAGAPVDELADRMHAMVQQGRLGQDAWQAEAAHALAAAGDTADARVQAVPEQPLAQLPAWAAPALAAAAGAAASAVVQVTLDTPALRPEFREALAAQVSTFARGGVQEAVLTLNPAEMGPITVQIALDGAAARIDFQAAQLATRELIEGSLPALATALQGEGLTLAGGSVGDQRSAGADAGAQQQAPGQREREARHAPSAPEQVRDGAAARPAPRSAAAGTLDLYA